MMEDAIDTAVAVLEWEAQKNPGIEMRELAKRLIGQVVANGCLVDALEVERLREALREVVERGDKVGHACYSAGDSMDLFLAALNKARTALNTSDDRSTVPPT